jgi:hypothetical protein
VIPVVVVVVCYGDSAVIRLELRQAVARFVDTYNTQWLIGRLGHRTPKEAYQAATRTAAA